MTLRGNTGYYATDTGRVLTKGKRMKRRTAVIPTIAATVIVLGVGGSALGGTADAQQAVLLPITSLDSFHEPNRLHYSTDIKLSPGTYNLEAVFQAQDCALTDGQDLTVLNTGPKFRGENPLDRDDFAYAAGSIEYLIRLAVTTDVTMACEAANFDSPVVVKMTATRVQLQ